MKIVNETNYDSGDILALWAAIRQACEVDAQSETYYYIPRDPNTLHVGYYTPSEGKKVYVKFQRRRASGRPPRLGIVRPKKLPLSPLQHLATAALDRASLPQSMIDEIIFRFRDALGSYGAMPEGEHWDRIREMKIHYTLRAQRGSLIKDKSEKKKIALSALRSQYWDSQRTIRKLKEQLESARACSEKLDDKIRKLEKELDPSDSR